MAKWKIVAQYEYDGIAWGKDEREAESNFLDNLNSHYCDTISFECVQICEYCEEDEELNDEGICSECAEDRAEEVE